MGKIILCSGVYADDPFEVPGGRFVYSIEELCYYVYENVIKLQPEFFSESLINWLRDKVQMLEIAEKLEFLEENNYSIKDKVVALLCSADYYTEDEIIRLIKKMNAWENMPVWKKSKLQADELLMEGHYISARTQYEKTLTIDGIDDENSGNIYHNIGVTKMYTASAGEAAYDFFKAYRVTGNEESLRDCIICYIMDGNRSEAYSICADEGIGEDFVRRCEDEYRRVYAEADRSEEIYAMTKAEKLELVNGWKKRVRKL